MNKTDELELLDAIDDFALLCFTFVGNEKAQEWAIKTANVGFVYEDLTLEERFYFSCYSLSRICHKIKRMDKLSDN
jgi:hypothetical protein